MLWQDVSHVCQCKGNFVRRANNGAVKTRGQAENINSLSSERNKELINSGSINCAHIVFKTEHVKQIKD